VGVPQAAAETRLHHDGFNVQTATQTSGQPRGRVIGQDPPAFSRVRKGSTVTLTISDGPGQATVPHVDGMGRIAAYRQLRHAGFKVDEVQQSSDTVTKNHVIATSPGNDQVIDKGATVTMYVSSGPQQIEVPDVRGQSFDDATATLDDAGFKWRRVEQPSDQPPGTVLSQDPIGGTPKPKGSRVTLYVAKESQTVAVPDVVGKTEDEAISTLFAAGLASKPVYQPVTDPNQDGKVIAQKPPAGKKVKRGSRVEFTVGQYTAPAQPPAQPPAPPPSGTGGVLPGPNSGVLPQ
jgi:serine/threonine-protein kinase